MEPTGIAAVREGEREATQSNAMVVAPPRPYSYEMGYGDFCLGRLLDRRIRARGRKQRVPPLEPGSHAVKWSFAILRSTVEIRHRIIRLLLNPLYNGEEQKKWNIEVVIRHPQSPEQQPARSGHYRMTVKVLKTAKGPEHGRYDHYFIEWFRQASNCAGSLGLIRPFLSDRPAALKGIKHLALDIKLFSPETFTEFRKLQEVMLKPMKLDSFLLCINAHEQDMGGVSSGQAMFEPLTFVRKIPVSDYFGVCLFTGGKLSDDRRLEWIAAIKGWLIPDTLREPRLQMEVERYLASRL
ncbi:hypothetical protein B0J14DRAFT_652555 [Halenospora varia]|nr:hypothetical protein B0J14DRAFT_652555 [Halenospora varia]